MTTSATISPISRSNAATSRPQPETLGPVADRRPDDFATQVRLGLAAYKAERSELAATAFERALAVKPDDFSGQAYADLLWTLGDALLGLGRHGAAERHLARATELQPDLAGAWCLLGRARMLRGDHATALPALEKGHALGAKLPDWTLPSAAWIAECRAKLR